MYGWQIQMPVPKRFWKYKHYYVVYDIKNFYFKTPKQAKLYFKRLRDRGIYKVEFGEIKRGKFKPKIVYNPPLLERFYRIARYLY